MISRQEKFHQILHRLFSSRDGMQQEYVDALLNEFLTGDPIDINQVYVNTYPLLAAIHNDRMAVFRWLLRYPQPVNSRYVTILAKAYDVWETDKSARATEELARRTAIELRCTGSNDLTALESACILNHYKLTEWLIADGMPPAYLAWHSEQSRAMDLAQQYLFSPIITRQRCRLKRGDPTISAACLFAIVISIDDYWRCLPIPNQIYYSLKLWMTQQRFFTRPRRFFTIARRLPTELQMLLCRRVYGLNGFNIPSSQLVLPTALLLVASGEYTWS